MFPLALPRIIFLQGSPRLPQRCKKWLFPTMLILVGLAALSFRLPNLSVLNDNYDEGVYLQSLLLMRHGYRPFTDIFASQGPLHLFLAYLPYALGGYTLSAARAGSVAASLLAIGGLAWAGRSIGGPVAGLGAALALGLSPLFLAVSRQALPEAPALSLAAASVGSAAWASHTGLDRWRIFAGVLLGLGCLVKPIVAPAMVLVLALSWSRGSARSALLPPLAAILLGAVTLAAVGMGAALDQVVGWRLAGQQPSSTLIWHNAELLLDKMFRQEQPAFYALAAVGAVGLLQSFARIGAALLTWLAIQLIVLLLYPDLSSHLGTTLLLPLALLAGMGLAAGVAIVRRRAWSAPGAVAVLVALWYVSSVPALFSRDQRLVAGLLSTDPDGIEDELAAVRVIVEQSDDDDFVVTDAPYLAFLANRMVPPALVDPSDARLKAGAATGDSLAADVRRYDPAVVIFWTGKLAGLQPVREAVMADFFLVAEFGTVGKGLPRAVYHKR